MRLSDEIAGGSQDGRHAHAYREGESLFGRVLVAAAPDLSRSDAERAARDGLSAMIGSAVLGLDPQPSADIRGRVVAVLRMALVPAHVEASRYDSAMRSTE